MEQKNPVAKLAEILSEVKTISNKYGIQSPFRAYVKTIAKVIGCRDYQVSSFFEIIAETEENLVWYDFTNVIEFEFID